MGIKLVHDGISGFHKQLLASIDKAVITELAYLGEKLVKYAKDNHNYKDRSDNLTSSMSYVIVRNKEIVFNAISSNKPEADEAALNTALKMAATLSNSYSLIIVAGMNYAAYVEAKGYNVILPAELKAKHDFPKVMSELINKVMKKFNSKK